MAKAGDPAHRRDGHLQLRRLPRMREPRLRRDTVRGEVGRDPNTPSQRTAGLAQRAGKAQLWLLTQES